MHTLLMFQIIWLLGGVLFMFFFTPAPNFPYYLFGSFVGISFFVFMAWWPLHCFLLVEWENYGSYMYWQVKLTAFSCCLYYVIEVLIRRNLTYSMYFCFCCSLLWHGKFNQKFGSTCCTSESSLAVFLFLE